MYLTARGKTHSFTSHPIGTGTIGAVYSKITQNTYRQYSTKKMYFAVYP
jgi:hypothetical protein